MRIKSTVFDWHFCPHARKTEIQQQQQKVATHPDCLGGRSQCQAPLLRVSEWELATTMRHTVCTVHTHARRVLSVAHSYMPTRLHSHTTKKLTQNSRTNKRNEFAASTTTRRRGDEETRARLGSAAFSRCELVKAVATVERGWLFIFVKIFECVRRIRVLNKCVYECVCVCKWQTHSISKQTVNLTKRYIVLYTYNLLLIKEYPRSLTQNGHPNAIQLCSAALRINWQNDRAKGKEDELHKRKDWKRDREREKNIDWSSKSVAVACWRVERSTTNLAESEDGDKSSGLWLFCRRFHRYF